MAWGPSIKDVGNFFWILDNAFPMAAIFYSYPLVNVDKFLTPPPSPLPTYFMDGPCIFWGRSGEKRERVNEATVGLL